jgi:hypothetical protein
MKANLTKDKNWKTTLKKIKGNLKNKNKLRSYFPGELSGTW